MSRVVAFTSEAEQDIIDAAKYLRAHSPRAAERFIDAVGAMAEHPGAGRVLEHSEPGVPEIRSVRVRQFDVWLLLYVDERSVLRIVRVAHGARDLRRLLDPGMFLNRNVL